MFHPVRLRRALDAADERRRRGTHAFGNFWNRIGALKRTSTLTASVTPSEIEVDIQNGPIVELGFVKPRRHELAVFILSNARGIHQIDVQLWHRALHRFARANHNFTVHVDCFRHPIQHDFLLLRHHVRRFVEKRKPINEIFIGFSQIVVPLEHLSCRVQAKYLSLFVVPERRSMRKNSVVRTSARTSGHVVHVEQNCRPSDAVHSAQHRRKFFLVQRHKRTVFVHGIMHENSWFLIRPLKRGPGNRDAQRLVAQALDLLQVAIRKEIRAMRRQRLHGRIFTKLLHKLHGEFTFTGPFKPKAFARREHWRKHRALRLAQIRIHGRRLAIRVKPILQLKPSIQGHTRGVIERRPSKRIQIRRLVQAIPERRTDAHRARAPDARRASARARHRERPHREHARRRPAQPSANVSIIRTRRPFAHRRARRRTTRAHIRERANAIANTILPAFNVPIGRARAVPRDAFRRARGRGRTRR